MPTRRLIALLLCFISTLFAALPSLRAHQVPGANLQLIVELRDDVLLFEVNAETSLVPPLSDLKFETDPLPTLEDRRSVIESYFKEHCPVVMDGIEVAPILTEFECQARENEVNLGEVTDFVMSYFILHYPLKSKPQKIDMRWSIFLPDEVKQMVPAEVDPTKEDAQIVDSVFYTYGQLDVISFSPEEPQFIWHTPKPVLSVDAEKRLAASSSEAAERRQAPRPVLPLAWPMAVVFLIVALVAFWVQGKRLALWQGAVLVASLAITFACHRLLEIPLGSRGDHEVALRSENAVQRFKDLHQNIYRAFDYDRDEEIYDTLAQSVSGDLLDEIYQEVYRSLIMKDEGGAVCRVKKVDYLASELADSSLSRDDGDDKVYDIDCQWRVFGLVKHWGHTHQRVNEYAARYALKPVEGQWKIASVSVSSEKRLDPKTLENAN